MLSRKTLPVWIGMMLLSCMFLMGQEDWGEPTLPRDRIVFVAGYVAGNIGGLVGADDYCQNEAEDCGLSGTYKAWLSDIVQSPATRFTKDGIFKFVSGELVANDWADLTDGILMNPIREDCAGTSISGERVWTATATDGTYWTSGSHPCSGWISSSPGSSALVGNTLYDDYRWTGSAEETCDNQNLIYCFQQ